MEDLPQRGTLYARLLECRAQRMQATRWEMYHRLPLRRKGWHVHLLAYLMLTKDSQVMRLASRYGCPSRRPHAEQTESPPRTWVMLHQTSMIPSSVTAHSALHGPTDLPSTLKTLPLCDGARRVLAVRAAALSRNWQLARNKPYAAFTQPFRPSPMIEIAIRLP